VEENFGFSTGKRWTFAMAALTGLDNMRKIYEQVCSLDGKILVSQVSCHPVHILGG